MKSVFFFTEPYKPPPGAFAASLFLHLAALTVLYLFPFPRNHLHPPRRNAILLAPSAGRLRLSPHAAPHAAAAPPRKFIAPVRGPIQPSPKLTIPVFVSPPPDFPSLDPPSAQSVPLDPGFFVADLNPVIKPVTPARPHVTTGSFGSASAATVPSRPHAAPRATGFSDVQAASPDVPARTPVVSSNFGDATFGDARAAAPDRHSSAAPVPVKPVEILEKPRPAYTEEARHLNVQGEVVLEVSFDASGQLRVLRIIRGLGHGLDETAVAAARQIRFRPALRDGSPVDSTAVIHIVFQLAN